MYIDKCFIVSCKFHEDWFVKSFFAVNRLFCLATAFNAILKVFAVEEMNSDTSIINYECGFCMPSDSLGKSLTFTRESRRTFVDILLGSAKGK
jgi:hypothetical protein